MQLESSPCLPQLEKSQPSREDQAQPKINKLEKKNFFLRLQYTINIIFIRDRLQALPTGGPLAPQRGSEIHKQLEEETTVLNDSANLDES